MGSGTREFAPHALALGRGLASAGVHLLTGGGGGVMAAVSSGFASVERRDGLIVGVLPAEPDDTASSPVGYPNEHVELVIRTHLTARGEDGADVMSRNHINVLSSDVIIAMPGGTGTQSENDLAQRYQKPLVRFDPWRELTAAGDDSVVRTVEEVIAWVSGHFDRR